jgi:hypothetical protein
VNMSRLLAALLLIMVCFVARSDEPALTRIRDLTVGQQATVKARVGQRVETEDRQGQLAFTIRDDYGDLVIGRTSVSLDNMAFGATYILTGTLETDPGSGKKYFIVGAWRLAYKAESPWPVLLYWCAGALLLAVIVATLISRFTARRIARDVASTPDEAWGMAEVESGPDQGKVFPLRGARIQVGRRPYAAISVALSSDKYVSRVHGTIIRDKDGVYYADEGSTGGSWVNEQQTPAGERVALPHGTLIRLGPRSVIRVAFADAPEEDDAMATRLFQSSEEQDDGQESTTRRHT